MSITLTTGCPHSGWDLALPALQEAGLELAGESFSSWHDKLFDTLTLHDPLGVRQPLHPDPGMADKAKAIVSGLPPGNLLLADDRSLWLLDFWAAELPRARFLLFYTSAETAIARMLLDNVNSNQLLEYWEACNQQIVQFQRRHRKRAILLDAETASREPMTMISACQRAGLTLHPPQQWPSPALELPARERVVAGFMVAAANSTVQALLSKLEASAQPLGDSKRLSPPQPEELLDIYLELKAAAPPAPVPGGSSETGQTTAERRQSPIPVHGMQQFPSTPESDLSNGEQEKELLLIQLHEVQEDLEHYFLENLANEEKAKQLRVERDKAMKEALELQSRNESLFWILMAPFRAISNLVSDKLETRAHAKLLRSSGLFDEAWYRAQYADVASAGVDPVTHYLRHGAAEGRNPSPDFDTRFYLESNPDVAVSNVNPLVHFVKFGKMEGRKISRLQY